jgi:hypothetical protein
MSGRDGNEVKAAFKIVISPFPVDACLDHATRSGEYLYIHELPDVCVWEARVVER